MKYLLRAAIGLICLVLIVNALVLVARGVSMTLQAYLNFGDPTIDRPLMPALEAVDFFFMSLAFFITAIGLAQLFVGDLAIVKDLSFRWLNIENFIQLKLLLWDTFLVTLLVLFITRIFSTPTLDWSTLVLPAAILMLTISSFLLKRKE
jgi:uncharacterized membrane protein YqhA